MIGKKIKELRELKGSTQEDLAKFLGVAPQTVYKYEKNINEPDLETTSKIADYFGISVDELLGRTDIHNELHQAASSDIDLAKLAKIDKSKKDAITDNINNMINMFYDEFGKKE